MAETSLALRPGNLAGLKVTRVKDYDATFNMLVYGLSGVGKTRLAGSADEVPEMRKVLYVDIEGGALTLQSCYPDVERVRVTSWNEMQTLYKYLHFTPGHGYRTIILDSLTEIQKFNMDDIMKAVIEDDPGRDPDVPSLREWNKNLEQIRRFVRAFRDLPVNTIFIALEKSDKDQRTGMVKCKPHLSGKLADEVAGFLDIVLYMYAKEVNGETKRLLQTGATERAIAKDRSDNLPIVVGDKEPLTMALLHKYIAKVSKERTE